MRQGFIVEWIDVAVKKCAYLSAYIMKGTKTEKAEQGKKNKQIDRRVWDRSMRRSTCEPVGPLLENVLEDHQHVRYRVRSRD